MTAVTLEHLLPEGYHSDPWEEEAFLPVWKALANRPWEEAETERLGKMGKARRLRPDTYHRSFSVPYTGHWSLNFINNNLKMGLAVR